MMETPSTESDRILLVNKPYQWTSFDVVNKLRYKLNIRKIGHAGTLDPLATGLLIICTGKMTREIEKFMGLEKEYTGTFILGQSTPSHDKETEVNQIHDISHIREESVLKVILQFRGAIQQVPPQHSAIRVGGKRAYDFARKGKETALKAREVEIKEFVVTSIALPEVHFKIVCSKGTYIRSLVRDIGNALGVGAYLSQLCRTRIGSYELTNAKSPEEIV
jgi:tRNA pseudouridine55 synthase